MRRRQPTHVATFQLPKTVVRNVCDAMYLVQYLFPKNAQNVGPSTGNIQRNNSHNQEHQEGIEDDRRIVQISQYQRELSGLDARNVRWGT